MADDESALRFVTRRPVLRRNLLVALVVGSILSLVNQVDLVLRGELTLGLLVKVAFNYLVPFIVASIGAALSRSER